MTIGARQVVLEEAVAPAPVEPVAPLPAESIELHLARISVNCHGPWLCLQLSGVEHAVKDVVRAQRGGLSCLADRALRG